MASASEAGAEAALADLIVNKGFQRIGEGNIHRAHRLIVDGLEKTGKAACIESCFTGIWFVTPAAGFGMALMGSEELFSLHKFRLWQCLLGALCGQKAVIKAVVQRENSADGKKRSFLTVGWIEG